MPPTDSRTDPPLQRVGALVLRYGLVAVLLWIGALKFTQYESVAVASFVVDSPLLSWIYDIISPRTFSSVLGAGEIVLALLIATRPIAPKLSALGSIGAIILFAVTLTFLFTTQNVFQPDLGFPYLSPAPGQFLAKDLLFLGAAIWTAGEAMGAAARRR